MKSITKARFSQDEIGTFHLRLGYDTVIAMSKSPSSPVQYEVEIKSLLGHEEHAKELKEKLSKHPQGVTLYQKTSQLNHYFVGKDLKTLVKNLFPYLSPKDKKKLSALSRKTHDFSVRTRKENTKVYLVIKASVDDTTSSNGITRIEFSAETPKLTIDQLDALIVKSGFSYQAKWSRDREEYKLGDVSICIDKNAGYGYLAEFELIVEEDHLVEHARQTLRQLLSELEIEELPQDRLERMFAYYNDHWQDYYGTENTFLVE
ncbi:MAG TPA: CYTH domain-containing protein [Patescibacteria group bacterium]|nr:CYTH domain-containing protein [Patescibacteria group bacterium]